MQPRFRLPTGQFKPASLPIIDWSHPRSRGLIGCYFITSMGLTNLTGFGGNLSPVGANTLKPGPAGWEGNSAGGGQNGWSATAPDSMKPTTAATLIWTGRVPTSPGAPSSNPPFFGITYDGSDSSPYYAMGILNLGGGVTGLWDIGGGVNLAFGSAITVADRMQQYALTMKASGSAFLYIDGVQNATASAGTGSFTYTATSAIQVHAHRTQIASTVSSFLLGLIYNRDLSPAEILAGYENPYDILIFPEDMLIASIVGMASVAARRPLLQLI